MSHTINLASELPNGGTGRRGGFYSARGGLLPGYFPSRGSVTNKLARRSWRTVFIGSVATVVMLFVITTLVGHSTEPVSPEPRLWSNLHPPGIAIEICIRRDVNLCSKGVFGSN